MNNFKKIGVTALAGSLMSLSVSAGEMAVTGTAEVTYTTNDSTGTGATSVGNPYGMKNNITFKGSGDVNGMAVSYQTAGSRGFGDGFYVKDMEEELRGVNYGFYNRVELPNTPGYLA